MAFKVGDKVKIINYGHPQWWGKEYWKSLYKSGLFKTEKPKNIVQEYKDFYWVDSLPDLVGQVGIICEATATQGSAQYAIDGINGKHAWYDEQQLELIK